MGFVMLWIIFVAILFTRLFHIVRHALGCPCVAFICQFLGCLPDAKVELSHFFKMAGTCQVDSLLPGNFPAITYMLAAVNEMKRNGWNVILQPPFISGSENNCTSYEAYALQITALHDNILSISPFSFTP